MQGAFLDPWLEIKYHTYRSLANRQETRQLDDKTWIT